ncbi:hypothetical protein QTI24_07590 [Variovorax sp. J22P240]|uniref:hypothetical protein n=1 Tax=Variovorax sp. J22P240 TaxID=3053514 RepID=UPI0025789AF0|nr:hypothetical protein [Variovorax sp. J22P240]MDL9998456.1 hypothetical protein [Variovorax sp. J22P240]
MALAGCNTSEGTSSTPASASATTPSASAPAPATPQASGPSELRALEVNGARVLSSQFGDLNGDGRSDALVVVDPASEGQAAGKGPSRTVLLLIRDADGHLQRVAQNDRIIPCERCGGLAGDPFGYARIDKEGFTLVTEGGSRERWGNEFTFKFATEQEAWILEVVRRGVRDTATGATRKFTLTAKQLGKVKFEDFDPSTLPSARLP